MLHNLHISVVFLDMPNRKSLLISFLLLLHAFSYGQLQPVGQWRDHLPYHQAIAVTQQQSLIWCATPYSVFSVDPSDNSIERFSRISGLSETGISAIGADPNGNKLVIAYTNSNVDVLLQNTIHNIDDIKNSTTSGNKAVNHIFVQQQRALLSTGLGIIVLNLEKYEVSDTWIIGNNGSKIQVFNTTADAHFYYAATEEGLKRAVLNAGNLADYRNWELISGTNGLPAGAVQTVVLFKDQLIVEMNDRLYAMQNNSWTEIYQDGYDITHLNASEQKLVLCETNGLQSRVVAMSNAGTVESILQNPSFDPSPQQAIHASQQYWIADAIKGLSTASGAGNFTSFIPPSPASTANGQMQILDDILWVAAGSVTPNWEPANNRNGLFSFSDNTWSNINAAAGNLPDSINDIVSLAIDPTDKSIWAGSFDDGLLHFRDSKLSTVFKQHSAIQPAYFATSSYRVSGLCFDGSGNLWISNFGSSAQLVVKKPDGNFKAFSIPFPVSENAVAQVLADDYNQVWIVAPKGNGLYVFSYGNSIDNPSDDQWRWYRAGTGNGNLPDNNVNCIVKDQSGFIWIGTNRGIGIVQCPQEATSSTGCEVVLPVVQTDNFAGYLFRDEQVHCIAVDGADRKWIGTKNGVWLISPDGAKTIYRFHAGNSPLVDNNVQQMAVNGLTGEVFFSTTSGICSFRSTATEGGSVNRSLLIFPNPVPPGYNGTIAIRGVVNNAIVKVTELDGRLVYQTRALGGQAIWNGRHYNGSKVSSGVYLILVTDDSKKEQIAGKIVFIK